ncbi:MAG: hypothetical protein RLZZ200_1163, partial [Pseudomonadota bacterium]
MSTGQNNLQAIFATPFASIETGSDPAFNEALAGLCQSRCGPTQSAVGALHATSASDFLDAEEGPVSALRDLVVGHVTALAMGLNSSRAAELQRGMSQVRGWCSIVQPGGHVPTQNFPSASWLAVYCVQAGAPAEGYRQSGALRLLESRLATVYRDASTRDMDVPYRYGHYAW